jgi:hypothetical protein
MEGPVDWNDFARRLAGELVRLPVDAYVIVHGPAGSPYVQAMRHAGGLAGEAISDRFLSEPQRLDLMRTQRMIFLGWREPRGQERVNWWYDLDLPADAAEATAEQLAECDQLAVRMVAALRDVYAVPSPGELEYRAYQNGPSGGPILLPGLGLRPAGQSPFRASPLAAPTAGRSAANGTSGPGWADFAERLAGELAGLDDGMVLVVYRADQDAYYVQAHRDPRRIRGEAVGNEMLDEALRFTPQDHERLAAGGWHPGPKWWLELPVTAPAAEFRRLAGMMVTALRDVQKAPAPVDLRYEAFVGDTGIELTHLGIPLAESATVSERRPRWPLPGDDSPAARPSPQAPEPVPVPEAETDAEAGTAEPDDVGDLEAGLIAAKQRGDQQAYVALLYDTGLIVPATGKPDVVEFATTELNDGVYVLTFTSSEAMSEALGDQAPHHRHVTVERLAAEWPKPTWKLSVNLGLPSEAYFDANVLAEITPAVEAAEVETAEAERDGTETAIDEPIAPAVMQKVVPHPLVVHYLEGGYDRVAGYVHRAADVADLTTPERLVRGLGLTYENSPFSPGDEAIHVIRWPVYKPELFRTPLGGIDDASMRSVKDGWVIERPPFLGTGYAPGDGPPIPEFKIASQRLPHGAELYRTDRSGEMTLVASFDADGRRWTREG